MEEQVAAILDRLTLKPPRSRLEPHRELIEELRHRKVSFQEIAGVLWKDFGVKVTGSGVHDFVRRRSRARVSTGVTTDRAALLDGFGETPQRTLSKGRVPSGATSFVYDPDEPLRLPARTAKAV